MAYKGGTIPDIRHAINAGGVGLASKLDLDDYALDTDNRDANGLPLPLVWSEYVVLGPDTVAIDPANELQVSVPAQGAPISATVTLSVTDMNLETAATDPFIVKTADFLLGGPLVDEYLHQGTPASPIPYTWCVSEASAITIPLSQSPTGGGDLTLSVSKGLGSSTFKSDSTILRSAQQQSPRGPHEDPIQIVGSTRGPTTGVTLAAGNLHVSADLSGLVVEADPGFADWARVTLTRAFDDGSRDCYTVAIAEALQGTTADLDGRPETNSTLEGLAGTEDFEGITLNDFIGNTVAGYNAEIEGGSNPLTLISRTAQTTAWDVRGEGSSIPDMEITSVGKPAATFPGATSGAALRLSFNEQDRQGILVFHKGIPPTAYAPGDVLTFSMNIYVDLRYDGVHDDEINEGSNGLIVALALADQLTISMGSFNYVDFPISQADFEVQAARPGGGLAGNHDYTNKMALLHGKWTRHQVSWRVPEIGQSVSGGPGGTGDLIDPTGITAAWSLQRGDTAAPVDQDVWLDNLCVSRCPGPLSYALGAIQVPMISAGWSFEFPGGQGTHSNFYARPAPHSSAPGGNFIQPAALNRGALINGNFSTNAGSSSADFPAGESATFFRALQNTSAGWIDAEANTQRGAAIYIGSGGPQVALSFPPGFNEALVLENLIQDPFGGIAKVVTPYLDLGLIDQALLPGLHVETAAFAAGSGGPSTLNQIENNVSGIYGLRFSARTEGGATPADNCALYAVLCNADVTNGLVAQVGSQMLPNGADNAVGGEMVWADCFLEGNIISFHSPQTVAKGIVDGAVTAGAIAAENPGRQTAQVQLYRAPHFAALAGIDFTRDGLGYENYLGEVSGLGTPAQRSALPGFNGSATLLIDEVGLYTVRDTVHMYDEDLCSVP